MGCGASPPLWYFVSVVKIISNEFTTEIDHHRGEGKPLALPKAASAKGRYPAHPVLLKEKTVYLSKLLRLIRVRFAEARGSPSLEFLIW